MGKIILDEYIKDGVKVEHFVDDKLIEVICFIDDTEITNVSNKINNKNITIHDIQELISKKNINIKKKNESEVYNILKSIGYNDKHVAKIMSYLRGKGYFK